MAKLQASKEGLFLIMLLMVVVAAVGAEAIYLEGVISAYLAGRAVKSAVHHSSARAELESLGNVLFIPLFFITIGFLIDVRAFAATVLGPILTEVFGRRLTTIGPPETEGVSERSEIGSTPCPIG